MFSEFSADIIGFDDFDKIIKLNLFENDFINTEERLYKDKTVDEHNSGKIISDCLQVAYNNKLPFEYYDEEKLKEFFQIGTFTEDIIKMFIGCGAFESVLTVLKECKEKINPFHITKNPGYKHDAEELIYLNPTCDTYSIYSKFPRMFWKCLFSNKEYLELFLILILYMKPLTEEQKDDILLMVFEWSSSNDDFETFVNYINRDIKLLFMISVFVFSFSIETPYRECHKHHIYAYIILRRVLEKLGIYQRYRELNEAPERPLHDIPYINENNMYWIMNDVYNFVALVKVDKVKNVVLDFSDFETYDYLFNNGEETPEYLIAQLLLWYEMLENGKPTTQEHDEMREKISEIENNGYSLMTIINYLSITNDTKTFKNLLMRGFSFKNLVTTNHFNYTYTIYIDEEWGDFEEEHTDTINYNLYLTPEIFRILEQQYGTERNFNNGFGHMINYYISKYLEARC